MKISILKMCPEYLNNVRKILEIMCPQNRNDVSYFTDPRRYMLNRKEINIIVAGDTFSNPDLHLP